MSKERKLRFAPIPGTLSWVITDSKKNRIGEVSLNGNVFIPIKFEYSAADIRSAIGSLKDTRQLIAYLTQIAEFLEGVTPGLTGRRKADMAYDNDWKKEFDPHTGRLEPKRGLPPVRSKPLLDVAKRLRDAWSMINNALDGLAMRGEKDSPLVRDLRAAQEEVETSRQAIYAHTSKPHG